MIYKSGLNPIYQEYIRSYNDLTVFIERGESEIDFLTQIDVLMESSGKESVLEKIGKFIIELFKKMHEFISKIFDVLTDMGIKNKSNLAKAEKMISRHPEFRNQIVEGLQYGSLDLSDLKSLKELDEAAANLTRLAIEGKESPDSIKGKWNRVVRKFKSTISSEKFGNAVGNVTKVVTLASMIALFKTNIDKTKKELRDIENRKSDLEKIFKDLEKKDKDFKKFTDDQKELMKVIKEMIVTNHKITRDKINEAASKLNEDRKTVDNVITKILNEINKGFDEHRSDTKLQYNEIMKKL